ncbi:MAG: long-chain fatty acid--CoA ligase [Desulfovibrionaceae bacterium]
MNEHKPWLRFYDPELPPNLDYEYRPLFEFLDQAAERWPSRTALIFKNYRLTYKKLRALSEVVAANLRARGVRPGDKVAIMLPNLPQTVIAYWGVLRAGAVVVMTNPLYMETEIVHQLNDSGARFMILLDLLWPKIDALRDRLPVDAFFVTSIDEGLRFPLSVLYRLKTRREGKVPDVPFDGERVSHFAALTRGGKKFTCKGIIPTQDTAVLQYTGGTTGVAKGCIVTHANLAANMQQCRGFLQAIAGDQETFIAVLPFFHIYGLTVCINFPTLIGGTTLIFPRYDPKEMLAAIHKLKPTIFPGAPAIYGSLIQQKSVGKYNLKSIKVCISGSAPLPADTTRRFTELTEAKILEGYGLTEASPVTHFNPFKSKQKPGSIGVPMPDTEARIMDMMVGGGEPLPPGKMGELVIRGPQVMRGYYERPADTADVLRNGWLYTGDIAYMDEDGYFFIVDRRKDLIISSGYNIYPREIDEVLHHHPKIREAVAVGIPHETRGEIVKVFVVREPGADLDKTEVIAYCKEKLAAYKVPRQVEFREDLPKTLVGKVLRRALREEEERKKAAAAERRAARHADASLSAAQNAATDAAEDAAAAAEEADLDADAG